LQDCNSDSKDTEVSEITVMQMQSEMADFTLGAATRRSGQNIHVAFDSGPFVQLYENVKITHKTKST